MTASADSEGRPVRRVPGLLGERGGKAEAGGSDLLPGGPQHPLAPHSPRQSRLRALPGPGRTPLTSQAAAAPRGAEPGPGGGSRRDGRGGSPGRGEG